MLIALYVDDLLIAGDDLAAIQQVKKDFRSKFKMKDLGEADEFLGMRIRRCRRLTLMCAGKADAPRRTRGNCTGLRPGQHESKES